MMLAVAASEETVIPWQDHSLVVGVLQIQSKLHQLVTVQLMGMLRSGLYNVSIVLILTTGSELTRQVVCVRNQR